MGGADNKGNIRSKKWIKEHRVDCTGTHMHTYIREREREREGEREFWNTF